MLRYFVTGVKKTFYRGKNRMFDFKHANRRIYDADRMNDKLIALVIVLLFCSYNFRICLNTKGLDKISYQLGLFGFAISYRDPKNK